MLSPPACYESDLRTATGVASENWCLFFFFFFVLRLDMTNARHQEHHEFPSPPIRSVSVGQMREITSFSLALHMIG